MSGETDHSECLMGQEDMDQASTTAPTHAPNQAGNVNNAIS
jgi:hypothetical protein